MSALAARWRASYDVARAPRVHVSLGDGPRATQIRDRYRGPHPRFRVVPYKRWGVALLEVPGDAGSYLRGAKPVAAPLFSTGPPPPGATV